MSKSLFIALALAMTLAACGKTEEPKPAATDAAATTAAPTAPAADAAPAAPAAAGSEEEKERVRKQNAAAEAALSGH